MKTTFGRLFGTTVVILLVSLLLLGTVFSFLVKDYLTTTATDELTNDARTIADLAAAYNGDSSLYNPNFLINLDIAGRISGADAVICRTSGQVVMCSAAPLGCEHQGKYIEETYVRQVLEEEVTVNTGRIPGLFEDNRYVVAVPITDIDTQAKLGIVIVSAPMEDTVAVMQKISDIFLVLAMVTVLVAVVLVSVFTRRQVYPLREMAKAASNFGHGDLTARVRVDDRNTQEVQELTTAFNNMASSLQKSEYQRQEFVANISHELKTPMTTIGGYVDGILDGTIPEENRVKYLRIVSDEVKRLSRLVRSMLDISRLQDQQEIPDEMRTRFDLTECVGQVLITFEQKILHKNLEVEVEMPEYPVFTRANQDYVTQVVYNLIDNAVKFCPAAGVLGIRVKEGDSKAYISVSNQGETIPPEELSLVFDRFHKTDKSRSQNRDGWGLGLYIVKTIVCSHGENISVTSRDGKTEFTFTMPLVN